MYTRSYKYPHIYNLYIYTPIHISLMLSMHLPLCIVFIHIYMHIVP